MFHVSLVLFPPGKCISEFLRKLRKPFFQKLIHASASSLKVSPDTGLTTDSAFATKAQLCKYPYEVLRQATKQIGHNRFPIDRKVIEAEKKCYPDNIDIAEKSAKVWVDQVTRLLSYKIGLTCLEKISFVINKILQSFEMQVFKGDTRCNTRGETRVENEGLLQNILHFTTIDGKVTEAATNTTFSSNFICGAKTTYMNDVKISKQVPK